MTIADSGPLFWLNKSIGHPASGNVEISVILDTGLLTVSQLKHKIVDPCFADAESKNLQFCNFKELHCVDETGKRLVVYTAKVKV